MSIVLLLFLYILTKDVARVAMWPLRSSADILSRLPWSGAALGDPRVWAGLLVVLIIAVLFPVKPASPENCAEGTANSFACEKLHPDGEPVEFSPCAAVDFEDRQQCAIDNSVVTATDRLPITQPPPFDPQWCDDPFHFVVDVAEGTITEEEQDLYYDRCEFYGYKG